jgi:hypothetical protein
VSDRETERREWQRIVRDLDREDDTPTPAATPAPRVLSPWVVDAGPDTTPEDRRAIQAYEDEITRLDRRDREW